MFEENLGRHVPMSCNLAWNGSVFGGKGEPVTMLFDFGMAEMGLNKVKPDFLLRASRDARRRGKAMVYTSHQNLGIPAYRLAIAGCYATGMHFMVPWDQFGGVNKPRVFSRPKELADLYGFVRANTLFLDGYEDAAAVGYRLKDSRWEKNLILSVEGADRVSAFIRAKPDDRDAPIVVHLIEWGEEPSPFRLVLHPRAFFETGNLSVALRVPVEFNGPLHEQAETSKQYFPLAREIALQTATEDEVTTVMIPALKPWGMLIVSKNPAEQSPAGDVLKAGPEE